MVGLIAACSGGGESSDSSEAAISSGRWMLPAAVKLAGAKVDLHYDAAPTWSSGKVCSGGLQPGSHVLGELLMDKFDVISSVGGYACRRNTADLARLSVHGTGRALDVFIPEVKGKANNAQGDKVANWLVEHAEDIGVQLIIWDRSMWRANGTNDVPYGGPVPHIDHIHVELTIDAAAKTKQWFQDSDAGIDDNDDGGADGGDTDADASSPDASDDADSDDASTKPDATPPVKDAGVIDAAPPPSTPGTPDAAAAPAPATDPGEGAASAGDESGEENSLPDRPKSRPTPPVDDGADIAANAGCRAAPLARDPASSLGFVFAFTLGFGVWLRRKRR